MSTEFKANSYCIFNVPALLYVNAVIDGRSSSCHTRTTKTTGANPEVEPAINGHGRGGERGGRLKKRDVVWGWGRSHTYSLLGYNRLQ